MGGGTGGAAAESSSSATTTTTPEASSSRAGRGARDSPRTREQRTRSVVEDQGVYNSTCGYCKASSRSSVAQGLWAYRLSVQDYQELLDRGWRRSGMFLYKPCMKKTCCPPYTIRLKAESFVATKDQMRVLRKMQRYLERKLDGPQTVGEIKEEKNGISERGKGLPSDTSLASASDSNSSICESLPSERDVQEEAVAGEEVVDRLKTATEIAMKNCVECGLLPPIDLPTVSVKRISQKVKGKLKDTDGEADYTSSISFAVMALLKRRSKSGDEADKDKNATFSNIRPEEVAEMIVANMPELKDAFSYTVLACKGHINFVLPGSNAFTALPAEETNAVQGSSDQMISSDRKKQPSSSMESRAEPSTNIGTMEVRMKKSSFDEEEFALYKKYQVRVHNDRPEDVKEASYRRFLVDTPLMFVPPVHDGTTPLCGFGSFHQQYLLDGKLVAVGVIDILPNCLSSKYLFWDPDLASLALGKYSALQEIKWVQEAQKVCSSLQYYYLGFYIHSCPKMRYKAAYYPSELLCPERFSWVPYDVAVPFLDKQAYFCLSDIARLQLKPTEGLSPGITSEEQTAGTSPSGSEETDNAMEIEVDFSESEEPEKVDISINSLLERSVVQRGRDSTGLLGGIQLYVNGGFISFKHLQELALVPQWHLDTLVHNLNRYLQVVGPSLASRIAYALS